MFIRPSALLCIVALMASCAPEAPYCGEAFCLSDRPQAVEKKALVDFNIYRITYGGEHFAIYEGDNPNFLGSRDFGLVPPAIVPRGFVEGRLYEGQAGYAMALRTPSARSPTYVVAYETKHDPMALQRFASMLRAKQSQ